MLTYGRLPHVGRHQCDTPLCVNPGHILDGSQYDNVQDAVRRGRHARGLALPHAKLSDEAKAEMFVLWDSGEWTQTALGRKFGVSQQRVSALVRGKGR